MMREAAELSSGPAGRLAAFVQSQTGWRRRLLAMSAGLLSVAAFAPVFASPVLFVTLPAFVWLIDSSDGPLAAARDGWWFGFGYFLLNLFWLGEAFLVEADKFAWMVPLVVTLLPAGMALFWSLAAAAARTVWRPGLSRLLVFAVALSFVEWLRGHVLTGLPWNVVGYALTAPLTLMQSASVFGAYGLTVLALLIFPAPLVAAASTLPLRTRVGVAALALLPLLLLAAFGAWRLSLPQDTVAGVKLRLVQPSVPQREKWQPQYQRKFFDEHLAWSRMSATGEVDDLAGVTHVIWPESSMPFRPLDHPEALAAIDALLPPGTVLIAGAPRLAPAAPVPEVYNSILVFRDDGTLAAHYDKIHLVPFGEVIPLQGVIDALGLRMLTHGHGSFTPGVTPRPLIDVPGLPRALGLVCYEVLFPGTIVQGEERPAVLINLTNDGWFGDTTGPRQHFHQTRVRAVEEGLPIIRAANNGVSAVIDAYGRAPARLHLNARGVIDSALPAAAAPTPYGKFGDGIFWTMWAVLLLAAWAAIMLEARK